MISTLYIVCHQINSVVYVTLYMLFSSLPIGAFQWPITPTITLTFNLNQLFLQQWRFCFPICVYPNPPCQPPRARGRKPERPEKPTTFGRVLTNSFSHECMEHWVRVTMRTFSPRIGPATSEMKGERSDHCATEAPYTVYQNIGRIFVLCLAHGHRQKLFLSRLVYIIHSLQ